MQFEHMVSISAGPSQLIAALCDEIGLEERINRSLTGASLLETITGYPYQSDSDQLSLLLDAVVPHFRIFWDPGYRAIIRFGMRSFPL